MATDEMTQMITAEDTDSKSAVSWLLSAAKQLDAAEAAEGDTPGQFTLTSPGLTGDQLVVLMRPTIEEQVERGGIRSTGHTAVFDGKVGMLTLDGFKEARNGAAKYARKAAERLRGARVQSVEALNASEGSGKSYEIVTVETNRELVQAAVLATLGDKLSVQRAIAFTTVRDDELTLENFFVVEAEDHYLSDVISGDANFDVRRFRGGVAVVVELDASEQPLTVRQLDKRLREVALQPEFEQYRTRESAIFPLGGMIMLADDEAGYTRFGILAQDESLMHDDDPVQWTNSLAKPVLAQVEAALGQEKSLSRVLQFSAPIAEQTKNRTMLAIVLALAAIVSYLWLRFGTKEYGLAASVALVHDVCITLGLVALSQHLYNTFIGNALMLDAFRIDLPMIAAVLTVIGYSLNDTIVVFDRIRENKGRVESLNPRIINNSINQTLARTLLTSITTFLVVAILYLFGGKGVHGFSFALMIGVVVGTYSSIGIATPLLYRPKLLHAVVTVIVAFAVLGIVFAAVPHPTVRWVLIGLTAAASVGLLVRTQREPAYLAPA